MKMIRNAFISFSINFNISTYLWIFKDSVDIELEWAEIFK